MLFNLNQTNTTTINPTSRIAKTTTTVPVTTTVGPALPANPNRTNYSIYNAGISTVYLREGAVVTSTNYDVIIPAGFYWREDFAAGKYTGVISVITASGTASLQVSEGATS